MLEKERDRAGRINSSNTVCRGRGKVAEVVHDEVREDVSDEVVDEVVVKVVEKVVILVMVRGRG